jgi:uncharacterized membrane protein
MTHVSKIVPVLILVALGCGGRPPSIGGASSAAEDPPAPTSDEQMLALLSNYCAACHSGPRPPKGVLLDTLGNAKSGAKQALIELGQKSMPPARATAQPTTAEVAAMVDWFQRALPPTE